MSHTPLKQIFDEAERQNKFDLNLSKRIQKFVGDLMNRNEEHVMFFGSQLVGTYQLRFKTSDTNEWMIDIKDIDEFKLKQRLVKESIFDPSWVRVNDAYNLDCLYTMHRFLNSGMPEKEIQKAVEATSMALNIKLLGSIMARYFPHRVDERIAQEVYSRLSRKFFIKKYGNWRTVMEKRSQDILYNHSKWYKVIKDFTDDAEIGQCISDIQGKLRSIIKYIWTVLEVVLADDAKFGRTSSTMEIEGEKVIKALQRDADKYLRYGQEVVLDKNTFIKPEVLAIIDAEMRNLPQKLLLDLLEYTVFETGKRSTRVSELIEASVQHAINTINSDRTASRQLSDISWLANKEKLLFMASKTNDPLVFKARQISEKLVREACRTKNPTMIATLKTSLILYIIVRVFTLEYYTR